MSQTAVIAQDYTVGEIGPPLSYQFLDGSGNPINLSAGYTAAFDWQERDGTAGSGAATVTDAVNGVVTHTWTGTEVATAGRYTAYFWAGNGANRFASVPIKFTARLPVGAVPQI